MDIVAVGTVALDKIETPFGSADSVLGGSATFISLSARHLCSDIGLSAVIGGDFPDEYRSVFVDRDINIDGLETIEDGKTFSWEGRYHYDLNDRDTLATHLNVLMDFDPELPEAYRDARILCLGNLDPKIHASVLRQVRSPEMVICDTMNYWIENTPDELRAMLGNVDCFIINDSEARQLAGEPNLVKAARIIQELGPRILIIKKGEHGALLFFENHVFSAPGFPLEEIYDPTGAGDAFMGGFAGYLASEEGRDLSALKSAVIFGSTTASFTVEKFGPERLLDLTPEEIEDRVAGFRSLSHIPDTTVQFNGF
ncbi:MAG: sugar kinase [Rhodothermales bacterium]|nr:sugar kinase [Rhodothermales bacterium]